MQKELNCLHSHRVRMDYGTAQQKGQPLGSGAMESTCRQFQTRFKRTGQFWTQPGDEALMCLETFRRNERWELLFPHAKPEDLSKTDLTRPLRAGSPPLIRASSPLSNPWLALASPHG